MDRSYWQAVLGSLLLLSLLQQACATDLQLIADRRHGLDGSCTGSSFSARSAGFSASDVGKVLVISGDSQSAKPAGPGNWDNAPLFATIIGVNSPSNVTLDAVCNSAMSGVSAAQWDLGTDNTIALQHCLDAGTCNVSAGSYLISGPRNGQVTPTHPQSYPYDSDVRPPSNSKLLCAPGAEFVFPHHDTYNGINRTFLTIENAHDVVISGCTISGTNLHETFTAGTEGNYAIVIVGDKSANNSIVNNTIRGGWSDGDIMINNVFDRSPAGVPIGNVISGNSISSCGFNGIAIVSGISNVIKSNKLIDCNLDIEPNAQIAGSLANGPVSSNLIERNTIIRYNRLGRSQAGNPVRDVYGDHWYQFFSTCGAPQCDDFGGDTIAVLNNTLAGDLVVFPYCRGGVAPQTWINNQTWTFNRTTFQLGTQCTMNSANCPGVTGGSCQPPVSSFNADALKIIDSIILN